MFRPQRPRKRNQASSLPPPGKSLSAGFVGRQAGRSVLPVGDDPDRPQRHGGQDAGMAASASDCGDGGRGEQTKSRIRPTSRHPTPVGRLGFASGGRVPGRDAHQHGPRTPTSAIPKWAIGIHCVPPDDAHHGAHRRHEADQMVTTADRCVAGPAGQGCVPRGWGRGPPRGCRRFCVINCG